MKCSRIWWKTSLRIVKDKTIFITDFPHKEINGPLIRVAVSESRVLKEQERKFLVWWRFNTSDCCWLEEMWGAGCVLPLPDAHVLPLRSGHNSLHQENMSTAPLAGCVLVFEGFFWFVFGLKALKCDYSSLPKSTFSSCFPVKASLNIYLYIYLKFSLFFFIHLTTVC